MALVELSADDTAARLMGREARLSVAVSNSPRSSVISGDPEAVNQVMAELERDDVFCRLVKVDVASHSPQTGPLAEELAVELDELSHRATPTLHCGQLSLAIVPKENSSIRFIGAAIFARRSVLLMRSTAC